MMLGPLLLITLMILLFAFISMIIILLFFSCDKPSKLTYIPGDGVIRMYDQRMMDRNMICSCCFMM